MANPWLKVVVLALTAMLAGVWLFRWTTPLEPLNLWGILSFAALGACIGCLWSDPSHDQN